MPPLRKLMQRWLKCEDEFIQSNYDTMSLYDMESKLGRSVDAIYNRVTRLRKKGVKIDRKMTRYERR